VRRNEAHRFNECVELACFTCERQMPDTTIFQPDLFKFLRQLKRHNNREWFAKNKLRYQQVAVNPAMEFISGFAPHLEKLSPYFVADARPTRGSLFRIYRDTRFSSDKIPYKTHIGIHFSHEANKDAHAPVFYLHLEKDACFAAAGVWHPDNRALTRIRSAIVAQPEQWKKATRKLELEGDSLARPPKGFCSEHPLIEDLKRKDFVVSMPMTEEQVCDPTFMKEFTAVCRMMKPLVQFTTTALGLKF
jgi:uncharacterized protein (TIGR02453 family)